MNRLNLWIDKEALIQYLHQFKEAYPNYVFKSPLHDQERLFFAIPIDAIERVYYPRRGLKEIMSMPFSALDEHLKKCIRICTISPSERFRNKGFRDNLFNLNGTLFVRIF